MKIRPGFKGPGVFSVGEKRRFDPGVLPAFDVETEIADVEELGSPYLGWGAAILALSRSRR